MKAQVNEIKQGLQHFSGTDMFYQIPLTCTRFTNGIKYLVEAAECFWLVTDTSIIAKSLMQKSYFITIDFKRLSEEEQQKMGCEATITYGDGNGTVLETHKYRARIFHWMNSGYILSITPSCCQVNIEILKCKL